MRWIPLVTALSFGLVCGYLLHGVKGSDSSVSRQSSAFSKGQPDSAAAAAEDPALSGELTSSLPSSESIEVDKFIDSLDGKTSFEEYGELHALLENASATDFASLVDRFSDGASGKNWSAISLVALRWADVDPEGMFAYANSVTGRREWGIRNALLAAWGETDPDAAIAATSQIESPGSRRYALQSVLQVVVQKDPQKALSVLKKEIGFTGQGQWVYERVFSEWSSSDPAGARQAALGLPDGRAKVSALSGALDEWIERDASGALAWLDSLPNEGTSYYARKEVVRDIFRKDFDAARKYLEGKEDMFEKRKILENIYMGNLAHNKSLEEVVEIFDWMRTVTTGQLYSRKVQGAVRAIAERDPEGAKAFVLQMPAGSARSSAIGSIASTLAGSDPTAALAFANSLEFEDEKQSALSSMSWQLSRGDVKSASRLILEAGDPMVERQLGASLAEEWSLYDRGAALGWVDSLSDESAKSSALQRIVKNWMQSDPAAALSYLDTEVSDLGKQQKYLRSAYDDWSRQDPVEAAEWLKKLPEGTESIEADLYAKVAQSYLKHDLLGASEWVSTLDEGPGRDRSVTELVNNISKTDPEAAFLWAGTVKDGKSRNSSLKRSVGQWAKSDPDAAYRAVRASKIVAAEKEPLFELIEKRREVRE